MIGTTSTDGETERLSSAAAWHARIDSGALAQAEWDAFTAWLEADLRHRTAFDRVDGAAREAADAMAHLS